MQEINPLQINGGEKDLHLYMVVPDFMRQHFSANQMILL